MNDAAIKLTEAQASWLSSLCHEGSTYRSRVGYKARRMYEALARKGLVVGSGQSWQPTERAMVGYAFDRFGRSICSYLHHLQVEAGEAERLRRRPVSLARVLACLSEAEARGVYEALAQWADNTRCGLDEDADRLPEETYLEVVEGVVEKLEAEFVRLAG